MGSAKGNTTETQVDFSPEAQQVLQNELQLFLQGFLPSQQAAQQQTLQGIGPFGQEGVSAQNMQRAIAPVPQAVQTAGEQYGVAQPDISSALTMLGEQRPELLNSYLQFLGQVPEGTTSLIDPRFAQFLRPDVTQVTNQSPLSQATQFAGIGTSVGGLALAL